MTYKDAGVDVDMGKVCSKLWYEANKRTWKNRKGRFGEVREDFDDYMGIRSFEFGEVRPDTKGGADTDGVGTKMDVAERMTYDTGDFSFHKTIPFDLVAMGASDIDRKGAEPCHLTNDIHMSHENPELVKALSEGLVEACDAAGIASFEGETAILPGRVGGYGGIVGAQTSLINWITRNGMHGDPREIQALARFVGESDPEERKKIVQSATFSNTRLFGELERFLQNPAYNWSASLSWVQNPEKIITGRNVRPGQSIVALYEPGFGSNGLSLVRKILEKKYSANWHMKEYEGEKLGKLVLTPCTIHTKAIREMHGGYNEEGSVELTGVAHITGGGIPDKLASALAPSGYGAELTDLFEPMSLMRHCQELFGTTDEEAYRTWNMGQRMMIITSEPSGVIEIAGKYDFNAKQVGVVIAEPMIKLVSQGYHEKGKVLEFKLEGK